MFSFQNHETRQTAVYVQLGFYCGLAYIQDVTRQLHCRPVPVRILGKKERISDNDQQSLGTSNRNVEPLNNANKSQMHHQYILHTNAA